MNSNYNQLRDYTELNECILELMSDRYQTRVLEDLEDMICINKYGINQFNEILEKHGIKITKTHGFKEYWVKK